MISLALTHCLLASFVRLFTQAPALALLKSLHFLGARQPHSFTATISPGRMYYNWGFRSLSKEREIYYRWDCFQSNSVHLSSNTIDAESSRSWEATFHSFTGQQQSFPHGTSGESSGKEIKRLHRCQRLKYLHKINSGDYTRIHQLISVQFFWPTPHKFIRQPTPSYPPVWWRMITIQEMRIERSISFQMGFQHY